VVGLAAALTVGHVAMATATADEGRRTPAREKAAERPNIVLITSDDEALSDLRWMPQTRRQIGDAGVRFSGAIAPNPLCCPARATLLTGQYSHNNGVRANSGPHGGYAALRNSRTVATWLHRAGYRNAFVGKYLNLYNEEVPDEPGWDSFDAMISSIYQSYGVTFNENGSPRRYPDDHSNDLVARKTRALVEDYSEEDDPFFIWSSYVAPHGKCSSTIPSCAAPPTPAQRHAGAYPGVVAPQLSKTSFNERDVSDKPPLVRAKRPVSRSYVQELFTQRIRTLASLDEGIADTISALRAANELDNTLIIFTSDNGYQLGEHRHIGKVMPYEESLRVPLLMRGPGVPAGTVRTGAVSHVDIARTIALAARATPSLRLDGRDLVPLARTGDWKPSTHVIGTKSGPGNWTWRGVRTQRYTWVRWYDGFIELYDRRKDPLQRLNVASRKRYAAVRKALGRQFRALKDCAGAECRQKFPPLPRVK
jgi:arylsulfatase A-like enzyme